MSLKASTGIRDEDAEAIKMEQHRAVGDLKGTLGQEQQHVSG